MKTNSYLLLAGIAWLAPLSAGATITQWQGAVNTGTVAAASLFTSVSAPVLFNVGTLTGDRAFEFIVRSDNSTPSAALLGTQIVAGGRQGLKFEQWNNTGNFGMTGFGVADYVTAIPSPVGIDTHVVFTSNGTKTDLYVNGVFQTTILTAASANVALALTGEIGLGGAQNTANTGFIDPLPGTISGFASYDLDLPASEILTHYNAFASPVPEASAAGLTGLALLGGLVRRRRA